MVVNCNVVRTHHFSLIPFLYWLLACGQIWPLFVTSSNLNCKGSPVYVTPDDMSKRHLYFWQTTYCPLVTTVLKALHTWEDCLRERLRQTWDVSSGPFEQGILKA